MALCIVDKRLPEKAKETLSHFAGIIEFSTQGITYDAISGHPDIFFCKVKNDLIISSNIPGEYRHILNNNNISYHSGLNPVQESYPGNAGYNSVVNNDFLVHKIEITDPAILDVCGGIERISVKQGYTRCNLLPLKKNSFITSDRGIYKKLSGMNLNTLYIKPDGISLPGFPHGFFGGACGIYDDIVFIAGDLGLLPGGRILAEFLHSLKYKIVELYDGPLFDGGSILFIY